MKEEFLKFVNENMTVDDMPTKDMKLIAESCGIDVAIRLMSKLRGGLHIYTPNCWQKKIVKKYILANPHKSAKEIANDVEMSETFVNKILNEKVSDDMQERLF
ncbi:hypothetical protein J6W78_03785 [bacterium]|nr:hypothetical protein [bacterium]